MRGGLAFRVGRPRRRASKQRALARCVTHVPRDRRSSPRVSPWRPRFAVYPRRASGTACVRSRVTFDRGLPQATSGSFLLCRKAMVVKCGVSAEGVRCVWRVPLNQTSGLQGHPGGGWGDLAGDDLGTGSGWKQSRQNQTPLCSDETRSPNTTANLSAALAAPLHLFHSLLADDPKLAACGDSDRLQNGRWATAPDCKMALRRSRAMTRSAWSDRLSVQSQRRQQILVNLPGWCWAEIQQFALVGLSSSLHSEACNALGASDGVIHSRICQEVVCLRATTNASLPGNGQWAHRSSPLRPSSHAALACSDSLC